MRNSMKWTGKDWTCVCKAKLKALTFGYGNNVLGSVGQEYRLDIIQVIPMRVPIAEREKMMPICASVQMKTEQNCYKITLMIWKAG